MRSPASGSMAGGRFPSGIAHSSENAMSMQELTLEEACQELSDTQMAIERASLEETQDNHVLPAVTALNVSDALRHLVRLLTQPLSLDEMLSSLANAMRQTANIDLCAILLMEQDQLVLRTCAPDLRNRRVVITPLKVGPDLWERLRDTRIPGQLPVVLTPGECASLNPLKNVQYATLLPLPLIVGNEYIGLMNCYSSKRLDWSADEQLLAATIASQVALAIKHFQHVEADILAQKNMVRSLFDDLFSGNEGLEESLYRQASFLGGDLTRPHVVVTMEISSLGPAHGTDRGVIETERVAFYRRLMNLLGQRLHAKYPTALVGERERTLIALLPVGEVTPLDRITDWLDELVRQVRVEQQVSLSVGVGNPCYGLDEYRRGYAEASEALEIGLFLHQEGGAMQFNALGVYRYIYKFARTDTLRDEYQQQILSIADYDQRKGTHLLETLEVYLESGGNTARAYNQLHIHRNTMLQRMERLQALCTIDLEALEHRLPLLVALKVYKLRARNS